MANFFNGRIPDQIAALQAGLEAQKTQFELALLKQKQDFETEIEELETALLDRIEQGEKSLRSSSLSSDGKKPDEVVGLPRYEKWSQRKARHKGTTRDPGFAQKVLKRSQRAPIVVETKES